MKDIFSKVAIRLSVKFWSCWMNRMKLMWMLWLLEPFYPIINESELKMC